MVWVDLDRGLELLSNEFPYARKADVAAAWVSLEAQSRLSAELKHVNDEKDAIDAKKRAVGSIA